MSCPQIQKIEKEKDREKEKMGDRPAKVDQKKSDRKLERDREKKETFFVGRKAWEFCSGGEKMKDASGHQGEN